MKKLLLIKLAAISAAITATVGLASCDFINVPAVTTADPAATQTAATTAAPSDTAPESRPSESGEESEPTTQKIDPSSIEYKAAKTIKVATTEKSKKYDSTSADECAVMVNGQKIKVSLSAPAVTKTGDSGDVNNSSNFGVNAGVLALGGSNLYIAGGTVSTDAKGANGIVSYGGLGEQMGTSGDGTTLTVSETKVNTTGDNASGILTAAFGKTTLTKLRVNTLGKSSPAIGSENDGGIINISGGIYTTSGASSPSIYGAATITAKVANFITNKAEGVVVDGASSVTLIDSNLTANNTVKSGKSKFLSSVLLYQNKSDLAMLGDSYFTMSGGRFISKSGHIFHVTNTTGIITLSEVNLINEDKERVILSVCPDGWKDGNNVAIFNVAKTDIEGKILVAKKGKLTVNLSRGTTFKGTFSGNITTADGETISDEQGIVYVNLGSDCTWVLTADTYITSFSGDMENVDLNGHKLIISGDTTTPTPGPTSTPVKKPKKPTKKPKKKPTKKPTKKATKKTTPKAAVTTTKANTTP